MAAGSKIGLKWKDYSNENASVGLPTVQIDAANLPQWLTDYGALKTALAGIVIGTLQKEQVAIYDTILSNAPSTNKAARRETRLFCRFRGVTSGGTFSRTIPCVDPSAFTYADGENGKTDTVVLADGGVMAALKTAMETIMAMPNDDTEDVELISAVVVGSNS